MNIGNLKNAVTSRAALTVLKTQKHSPTILFAVGVAGVVGTAVLASRATLNLDSVVADHEKQIALAESLNLESPQYTDDKLRADKRILKVRLAVDIAKLYAPSVALGVMSIAALGGSHMILTKRNAGLVAAFTTLEAGFNKYRERVVTELGEDKDLEFLHGVETREVYVEGKKGGPPKVEEVRTFSGENGPYAIVFDQSNINWQGNMEYNLFFLRMVQNNLNDRLRANGHVFLNDLRRELGVPDTKTGAVTGWVHKTEDGDGYVDLGIWTSENKKAVKEFFIGSDGALLINPNVEGYVLDKI